MENKNNKIVVTKKKILSLICLIVFSLTFIFACLKSVLPIGQLIVCTFGLVTYPLFLILGLIELAKFLGLKYKRSTKETWFVLVLVASLLFAIQSIMTYGELDKVASFASLKGYLNYSYTGKVTLVGSFGSIFVGSLSILFGAMGAIVACVIAATISLGLVVDYENYGKFENENITKLKGNKLRNKVNNSDKNITSTGEPVYGFNEKDDGVIDTIEANESEINLNNRVDTNYTQYSPSEVIGETFGNVIDEPIDDYPTTFAEPEATKTDDALTLERKKFLSETFPGYNTGFNDWENTVEPEKNDGYGKSEVGSGFGFATQTENIGATDGAGFGFGGFDTPSEPSEPTIKIEDDIKNILTKKEDEVQTLPTTFSNGPKQNDFGFGNVESASAPEPVFAPKPVETPKTDFNNWETRNEGIMSEPAKPQFETPKPVPIIPTRADPIAMPGVRYNPPPLSLLKKPIADTGNYSEEQARKTKILEEVLDSFGISAKVANIVRGPKITRYELSLPHGVSVKRIPNYELDIQSALAAKTITIRAPIPGSQYVGIELENEKFTSVYERELLASAEFQNAKDPLPIAIGKDISGEIVVKSLAKMVHVLIAGSTGSGKSVFIHNIIMSLIYKYSPTDMRLILIDPKKVEFSRYNGLPHLITPEVVMGADKAINALKWCVKEMDRRYSLMQKAGYNNIEPYNKSELVKAGQFEHMPYIVIIVDELAEIMLASKKDSEVCIQRITQLARACGMHLILATQRPSVDIISGVIKNNIPSRIAFSLQSGIDSKTILNTVGAEKLLGQGDMLFAPTGTATMPRLQAAYATDEEIGSVIDFDIKNNKFDYDSSIEAEINAEAQPEAEAGVVMLNEPPARGTLDSLFKVAIKSVMMSGSASVSYLQRRLGIGYARAAKIIDQMEERGYVAPPTGAKQRKVFITPEQFKEEFGEEYNS